MNHRSHFHFLKYAPVFGFIGWMLWGCAPTPNAPAKSFSQTEDSLCAVIYPCSWESVSFDSSFYEASLEPLRPDTTFSSEVLKDATTLKRAWLTYHRQSDFDPSDVFEADTLMDINGDGWDDLIFQRHAAAGFGPRYLHTIYLWDTTAGHYHLVLTDALNLSFSPNQQTFYSTYLGYDFIHHCSFRWNDYKPIAIAIFEHHFYWNIRQVVERRYHYDTQEAFSRRCYYHAPHRDFIPKKYSGYLQLQIHTSED